MGGQIPVGKIIQNIDPQKKKGGNDGKIKRPSFLAFDSQKNKTRQVNIRKDVPFSLFKIQMEKGPLQQSVLMLRIDMFFQKSPDL